MFGSVWTHAIPGWHVERGAVEAVGVRPLTLVGARRLVRQLARESIGPCRLEVVSVTRTPQRGAVAIECVCLDLPKGVSQEQAGLLLARAARAVAVERRAGGPVQVSVVTD